MIRHRLVAAVTAVAAVAVLLSGWLVLVSLENRLVDNLDRDLRQGSLSDDIREVLRRRQTPINRPTDQFDPVNDIALVFYAPSGTVVDALPSGRQDSPDPLPNAGSLRPGAGLTTVGSTDGGPRYRAAAVQATNGGTVVVAASMASIDETIADTRRILRNVGLAAVAAIALLSWVLIRRALSPIEGMITTADLIAGGDLTERTDVDDETTEVGRLGRALDTMLDRLEVALADKTASEARMRRFVAEASHELRTPLTSVRGYAELYRQGGDDPATVATSMQRIETEAMRMHRLVEDLLLLARMDQARPRSREPVDLGHLAGDAVDAARVVDGSRSYDLDTPADPAVVEGDPHQLRQVLDNLLTNARSHTPAGTTVTTMVRSVDDGVELHVRDDGPGIAPADRAHAFDRFWRGIRSDENPVDGTGLGLAIVQSIVTAHGGTVALDEAPGGGACFTLRFPSSAVAGPAEG